MSDNEGSDRGLAFADDESANDVFGAELWAEVKEVCERTVGLLGGDVPAGRGETVRVCLDLPKGLVLTAQYVVGRERLNREWSRMEELLEEVVRLRALFRVPEAPRPACDSMIFGRFAPIREAALLDTAQFP